MSKKLLCKWKMECVSPECCEDEYSTTKMSSEFFLFFSILFSQKMSSLQLCVLNHFNVQYV
jgi:hypothetical protein